MLSHSLIVKRLPHFLVKEEVCLFTILFIFGLVITSQGASYGSSIAIASGEILNGKNAWERGGTGWQL